MLWLVALITSALAQEIIVNDPPVPEVNAQLYRPTIDSHKTMWTDTSMGASESLVTARLAMHYVNRPFLFRNENGEVQNELVSDALQADVIGALNLDRARIGVDVPVYLLSVGDLTANGAGIGDIALDGRLSLVERNRAPFGLGFGARATVPSSSVEAPLGASKPTAEFQLMVDSDVTDELLLAMNVGTKVGPLEDVGEISMKDQILLRLGGGYSLTDDSGVSADVVGAAAYSVSLAEESGTPIEGMLGGWYRVNEDLVLRGGLGRGFTRGIGSSNARAVLVLAYEPKLYDSDNDGYADHLDECPQQPEDFDDYQDEDGCPEIDNDGDGIADVNDDCPMTPEDMDLYEDEDGCPDASTLVQFDIVDADGLSIPVAIGTIVGHQTELQGTGGKFSAELHDGTYELSAIATDFVPGKRDFTVTPDLEQAIVLQLEGFVAPGTFKLMVVDEDNAPIDDAKWSMGGIPGPQLVQGRATMQVPPGRHAFHVEAAGFVKIADTLEILAKETLVRTVVLRRPRVKITKQRIDIRDSIFFELNKAIIKEESFSLLNEVASILIDHPELLLVRIEGHTDSRGSNHFNQGLSDRRAASVRNYLIERGVAAERLSSIGYGETKPLDPAENEEAWAKNRRVDFFIEKRAD